ncbi:MULTISPECIES: lipopolysaccharide biosynthesis protein [unclassified Lactococcus]|uniref:lipopolysaccharide biosynthesis protein n=1 Tax=unclassified Lactococcus TaxID=2643510 RepID=UPI0011CBE3F6|nr:MULTISPECIES: polysaccharide biosynthesis C-terminal domain-containing protein [unclassified Lactococcus]MQW22635.1 oligosaccharide flippase family protein [Lactococcus sp. dk101]TXK45653.1 oligosaccharide flippase family protein [Lactococcus sp. dk310]TXK51505.1 oligosaccharide flippase family protein [Lactococcus sp. dk322]
MKSQLKKLAGNTLIFTIGNGISLILSFIMVPFYTKVLTTSEFGLSDIIITTVSMLLPLLSLNIFSAIFRYALDKGEDQVQIFTNGFVVSVIGMFISLGVAGICSIAGLKYSFLIGVYLSVTLFLNLFQNFTRGIGKVKTYALSGIINSFTNVFSNLLLMWIFKLGLNGYLYSLIISVVSTSIFLFFYNKLYKYIDYNRVSWIKTKELLRYSIPMIPNSFAWWLTNDANKIIILTFLGTSANGLLAVANKIPSMITTLFSMFTNAWQMTAVDENGKKNTSELYNVTFNMIFGGLIILCSIIVLFIRLFMKFYVDVSYFEAWKIVPFLLLSSIFSSVSAFFGTTYLVAKETKGLIMTTIWGMITNIVFCLILVPIIGINGAGVSGSIGFLVVSMLRFKQTKKYVQLKLSRLFLILLLIGYLLITALVILELNIGISFCVFVVMIIIFVIKIFNFNKRYNVKTQ